MNKLTTRDITQVAVYAAIIVLAIYVIRVPMPSAISQSFVHPGNALVILAILFMGFRKGFLAAMLGLALFDITSGYASVAWITLLENAVVLLVVEGVRRYLFKERLQMPQLVTLGIVGALTKIIVIFIKFIFRQLVVGAVFNAAIATALTGMPASLFTGLVTAILVPILYWPLKPVFQQKY